MTSMVCKITRLVALLFMIPLTFEAQKLPPRKVFLPKNLKEISGITPSFGSGKMEFWALNDSDNPAVLFHFSDDFSKVEKFSNPKFQNRDWEALASDPAGNLYIGDFGNNFHRRRDLKIYIFNKKTNSLDSLEFVYPDQKQFPPLPGHRNFNCEAMVFWRDSLHLFSKNDFDGNFFTKHYALPARPGKFTAQLLDSIFLKKRVVTDAAISRDGQTLALTTYYYGMKWKIIPQSGATVWFFDGFSGSRFFSGKVSKQKIRKFLLARQVEAVCHFDKNVWLVGNEKMFFNRASLRRFNRKPR